MAEEKIVRVKINGEDIVAYEGENIIELCRRNNIKIPHLCYHERLPEIGACRLCIVEVEGARNLLASCVTPVREGMNIFTHSPRVIEARKINLKLLLANHDLNCTTCKRNLNCKLQKYAEEFMIEDIEYEGERRVEPVDNSSVSIRRNNNKCVLCQRCIQMCNEVQSVYAIGLQKRGFHSKVSPPFDIDMNHSACVNCGQCVIVCPSGALTEHRDIQPVIDELNDKSKIKIAQVAPSIRATIGEMFGFEPGTPVTGKVVAALRELGFDYVFDTDFAADVTIVEEATEFIQRFTENKDLPLITTCCPAWIKFGEQFYYDEFKHMSSCKSPMSMLSSLVKNVWAKKIKINPKNISMVAIMPCTAKKYECLREEYKGDTDHVLTTVELAKLIKQMNIDFKNLADAEFDNPMGLSTGAGVIFGRSGGVMEAALRTAADWIEDKDIKSFEYNQVRGMETKKEATLTLAGKEVRICVVHTLGEARQLMEQIRKGESPYHFIEIMACYGGCIGGGGQPALPAKELLAKRMEAIAKVDTKAPMRKSHKNPAVQLFYKESVGKYGGTKAHKLLHTHYVNRQDEFV